MAATHRKAYRKMSLFYRWGIKASLALVQATQKPEARGNSEQSPISGPKEKKKKEKEKSKGPWAPN